MSLRVSFFCRSAAAVSRRGVLGGVLLGFAVLCGCQSVPKVSVDWKGGPFFTATNFAGVAEMPPEVRRVAVMPLAGVGELPPDSVAGLAAAMQGALLAEGRFEVAPVPAELVRSVTGHSAVDSTSVMPPELFSRIQRELGADAVLFVDITHYRPYAPLALGVRVKLADCGDSPSVLWAFDTLYDLRDPAVANSARRHAIGGRPGLIDSGASALQSPSRFAGYVFADAFAALPQRPPPAPLPPPPKVSPLVAD